MLQRVGTGVWKLRFVRSATAGISRGRDSRSDTVPTWMTFLSSTDYTDFFTLICGWLCLTVVVLLIKFRAHDGGIFTMIGKHFFGALAVAILVASASLTAVAQVGELRGHVWIQQADGQKVPLADAQIDVFRTDMSAKYNTKTNKKG